MAITGFEANETKLLCNNGAPYDTKQSCLYDRDQYGNLIGCRDATHLQNCGMYKMVVVVAVEVVVSVVVYHIVLVMVMVAVINYTIKWSLKHNA